MKKIELNKNWFVKPLGSTEEFKQVDVPYDAMIFEPASDDAPTGKNGCWIMTNDYEFRKSFDFEEEWRNKILILEFEGVYRNANVYLNGQQISSRPYGYTNFFVDITDKVNTYGRNELKVLAYNKDQPNQRWYSGCGIIRPVNLYVLPKEHIKLNSIRVTLLDYITKEFRIQFETTSPGKVKIEILENGWVRDVKEGSTTENKYSLITKSNYLELWSPENPKMYDIRVTFKDDVQTVRFGLRKIQLSKKKGFLVNGKRYLLKGACIHSENGLLGNVTHYSIEHRKVKLLKDAGYNALRCAHNPASKCFLEACDNLGMLIIDEYVDCWYTQKTKYDYTKHLSTYWKEDLKDMIEKDYNHPCVVMYSVGNEVGESAQKRGQALLKDFVSFLHRHDSTRPVTCGINIFFNMMTMLGVGFHSDKKAKKEETKNVQKKKKQKAVGSELFNNITNMLGAPILKFGAKFPLCDVATKKPYALLDVAGYNYGILRVKHDLKKYKNRFVVSTETFCADAKLFIDLSKKLPPRFIGDFVWAGMDYLGEVGVGSWVHADQTRDFQFNAGWMSAGSGRLDLLGNQLCEMAYTRVAYGLDTIRMGVIPPTYLKMKRSTSSWKFSRAIESWTFPKRDIEKMAVVEVYCTANTVKLFNNEILLGTKKTKRNGRTIFKVPYIPGNLTAVAYDKKFKEVGRTTLTTSKLPTILKLTTNTPRVQVGDYVFIDVTLQDARGILKPLEDKKFKILTDGQACVFKASGNACPYQPDRFNVTTKSTYFGKAQVIVQAVKPGPFKLITATEDGKQTDALAIYVTN